MRSALAKFCGWEVGGGEGGIGRLKIIPHPGREMCQASFSARLLPSSPTAAAPPSSRGAGKHDNRPVLISSPWSGGGGCF